MTSFRTHPAPPEAVTGASSQGPGLGILGLIQIRTGGRGTWPSSTQFRSFRLPYCARTVSSHFVDGLPKPPLEQVKRYCRSFSFSRRTW